MEKLLMSVLLLICPLSWLILGSSSTVEPIPLPTVEPLVLPTAAPATTIVSNQDFTGVIFPAAQAEMLGIDNLFNLPVEGYWTPIIVDISALESNLTTFLADNSEQFRRDIEADLPQYIRQYVGFYSNGDPMIYVNALCDGDNLTDWQTDLVLVADGGDCYFQVIYNTTTDEFSNLTINGEA